MSPHIAIIQSHIIIPLKPPYPQWFCDTCECSLITLLLTSIRNLTNSDHVTTDDTEVAQNISQDTELDELDDGDLLIRDDDLDEEDELDELDDELAGMD